MIFPFLSRYISELLSRHGQETAIVPVLVVAQSSLFLVRVAMKLNSYGWNLFFNYNNKYNGLIPRWWSFVSYKYLSITGG